MEIFQTLVSSFQSGGVFMYPILLILAMGTAIIIDRLIFISKAKVNDQVLWQKVKGAVTESRLKDGIKHCDSSHAPLPLVLKTGLLKLQDGGTPDEIRNSLEEVILERLPPLERRTHYLPTLANVATLLGLLGTIIGLIQAFAAVAAVDPSQKAALLAQGISVAMNTTAFGLVVAIPIILCYSFLLARTHKITEGIDEVTTKFLNLLMNMERVKKEKEKSAAPTAVKNL